MKRSHIRLILVFLAVFMVAAAIVCRLVWLQLIRRDYLRERARQQQTNIVTIAHERGLIVDKSGIVFARNLPAYSLYADPGRIDDPSKIASQLASYTGFDVDSIVDRLTRKKSFVWIKRKLFREERNVIEELNLPGIGFLREFKRFYPQETLGAHVLGMVDVDNKGIEALELKYDRYLSPNNGEAVVVRDSKGKNLPIYREFRKGTDGYNLNLTVDAHIQYWAEQFLREAVLESKADGGAVVVMDPGNGRILALCNYPTFDPNNPGSYERHCYRNRAVADYYEPGSVFKVVTLVAALENLAGIEQKTFFCENGKYKIPGTILHDWKGFGNLRFEEVFMQSSNIGVAKIVQMLGSKTLHEYIGRFGFGEPTGIDLPFETPGYVKPLREWSKTSPYIIPMGQEVTASLLQLARGFSVIANGGFLVRPYIVERVTDKNHVVIHSVEPQAGERVISEEAARKAREILRKVVDQGTGRRGQVKGVAVAGKTGTAQKISPAGGYSKRDFFATFAGFFPADAPRYVIAVNIDEAHGPYHTGGMIAAPLFQKIADKIADYQQLRDET
jgi:cell division protein FtsI (penicillin-binding protein 3)